MRRIMLLAVFISAPAVMSAQKPLPASQQIALAVLALPRSFRADATVLGYNAQGELVTLRRGKGRMICLAHDPKEELFHVACYQDSMEPFMARGRELRAHGTTGTKVDSIRFAEARSGKLPVPKQAAALWQLFGPMSAVNAAAGTVTSAVKPMYVVYMPFATSASTGLPAEPLPAGPWLMDAGTPKAHIMFIPSMVP